MAIWKKDEQMYTAIQDLMRTYLMHDHTPNIESFGGPTGSQLNRYILAGKLALDAPRLLPGDSSWMRPGRLASLIIYLKDITFDRELTYRTGASVFY